MSKKVYCYCGRLLHDGACYEVNAVSKKDALAWEWIMSLTPEQREHLVTSNNHYIGTT